MSLYTQWIDIKHDHTSLKGPRQLVQTVTIIGQYMRLREMTHVKACTLESMLQINPSASALIGLISRETKHKHVLASCIHDYFSSQKYICLPLKVL